MGLRAKQFHCPTLISQATRHTHRGARAAPVELKQISPDGSDVRASSSDIRRWGTLRLGGLKPRRLSTRVGHRGGGRERCRAETQEAFRRYTGESVWRLFSAFFLCHLWSCRSSSRNAGLQGVMIRQGVARRKFSRKAWRERHSDACSNTVSVVRLLGVTFPRSPSLAPPRRATLF